MNKIVGASYTPFPGSAYPWQKMVMGINTENGNKLTPIPIVAWKARGGLPVNLTLYHNSQTTYNGELGHNWTHSYDIGGTLDESGDFLLHWGDDHQDTYTLNVDGSFSPLAGLYNTLVKNTDSTYTLTTHDQVIYHFTTGLACDTISDRNGNTIDLGYTSGKLTTITDTTSSPNQTITLTYTGSRISSITDPYQFGATSGYRNDGDAGLTLVGASKTPRTPRKNREKQRERTTLKT